MWRSSNAQIAAQFRSLAVYGGTVDLSRSQAGALSYVAGESDGRFVELPGFGNRRAYLKPVKPDKGFFRAAHEKVAADLAFDLRVPVPPVLLYRRQDRVVEPNVSLSLVMYPRQISWAQAQAKISSAEDGMLARICDSAARSVAAMGWAFDTWVQQEDHNNHPHNIILGWNPADIQDHQLIFLDYAFSLGFGGWRDMEPARYPPLLCERSEAPAMSDAISRIESLPDAAIVEIVERVPTDFLPQPQGEEMISRLIDRKRELRETLLGGESS